MAAAAPALVLVAFARTVKFRVRCGGMRSTTRDATASVSELAHGDPRVSREPIRRAVVALLQVREKFENGIELLELINKQKCSDSVLHEAKILFRHFVTAECPDKKGRRCRLTHLLSGYPPPDSKPNTSKMAIRVEGKQE